MNRLLNILLGCIIYSSLCSGQETLYGPGFQTVLVTNPAFSGAGGDGTVRLSYMNFYPGNGYNFNSVYLSYDSYFEPLHGGAAIWLANDNIGDIVNDIRGGLSYAYFLRAGSDLFINAGLYASVYNRGFNFSGAVLPDQIDPLNGVSLPSSESLVSGGKTIFDLGAGFLFIFPRFFAGFSLTHLSQPEISFSGDPSGRLHRRVSLQLAGDLYLNKNQDLLLRPVIFGEVQSGYFSVAGGGVFETAHFSINSLLIRDNGGNMNVQAGFSVSQGKLGIFYNYRFNVLSGNSMMPFSLLHQVGLALGLNHVEKRTDNKTISITKM